MAYQLLATVIAYLGLFGFILLVGRLSDVQNPIKGRDHLLRVAVRLAIVLIATAIPCVLLGAHPLLIIGLLLVLPIVTTGPLGETLLALPTLLLYGWITMPPGSRVISQLTHQSEPPQQTAKNQEAKHSMKDLIGTSTTVLRPHGTIKINGESYEAKAQMGLIQADRPVRVLMSENDVLIVKEEEGRDSTT